MFILYSYKGYTITNKVGSGLFNISYPNELEPSIYTYSLDKAYQFIDKMEGDL